MDKDKNKISDTDSFWNQSEAKHQEEKTASVYTQNRQNQYSSDSNTYSSPLAAEKADGSIAIDRERLLQAVGQLTQHPLEASPSSYKHDFGSVQEERDVFASGREERSASVKDRKKASRTKQKREKAVRPAVERKKDGSVSLSRNTVMAIAAAAIICIGSFLGIFYKLNADKQEILTYIQTELADIRAKNDAAIAEMGETLDRMETNFDEIVSLLEETGAAIGSSSQESRAAISERIEKLDKQLQSLQKSLAVLQEDANGRKK